MKNCPLPYNIKRIFLFLGEGSREPGLRLVHRVQDEQGEGQQGPADDEGEARIQDAGEAHIIFKNLTLKTFNFGHSALTSSFTKY